MALYINRPEPTQQHPLAVAVNEAEAIIAQLHGASERLQAAISRESLATQLARSAAETYDGAEAEAISEQIVAGMAKEGPLAGIATSSKAYDITLGAIRADLRSGKLSHLHRDAESLRTALAAAKSEIAQAEAEFSALKRVAELKTAILNAMSGVR